MFPYTCFGFKLEVGTYIIEFVPSAYGPFIDHHQALFLKTFGIFYDIAKNYVNV